MRLADCAGHAAALRAEPDSRSRKRAGPAGSPIASDLVGDHRSLCGVDFANESIAQMEFRQRHRVGTGAVGFIL